MSRNMRADLEQRFTSARQQWRVRSADLTQVPGDVLPVNKTRPPFLPRLGNGPPPATK